MADKQEHKGVIGVVGAGSFGITIASLLSTNVNVLVHARREEVLENINTRHEHLGVKLSERVRASNELKEIANQCRLIFPIVPSDNFRAMMQALGPHLKPYHVLIHGTKGLDVPTENAEKFIARRANIHTMSEVIRQESVVLRVGCLSGPNLSSEINAGQPAATVIASQFKEVIKLGQEVLRTPNFQVFGSYEVAGAEFAGAFKNIIAIGSGILRGLKMGENIRALLINRGLVEMIYLGKAMGAPSKAFIGIAGIGDLIATASSKQSRNFSVGYRLAQGKSMDEIREESSELAEGVRTLRIAKKMADYHKVHAPITQMLYRIVYDAYPIDKAIRFLMTYPYAVDIDFL